MDWSHGRFMGEVRPRWGNSPKSKILVVTKDKKDKELERKCSEAQRTNKMDIRVIEWEDYPNLESLIFSDDTWRPTTLVVTFDDGESRTVIKNLRDDMRVEYQKGTNRHSGRNSLFKF